MPSCRWRGARAPSSIMLIACLALLGQVAQAQSSAPAQQPVLTLEDIYSEYNVIDAALSPNGTMIAATIRRGDEDMLVVLDVTTGQKRPVTRLHKDDFGTQIDTRMGFVWWKTDARLLFQLRSRADEGVDVSKLSHANYLKLGRRLFAVDLDGKNFTTMFGKQIDDELVGAFDTSDIASILPNDPQHILVEIGGWEGRSLYKVDVTSGRGKIVEPQKEGIVGWWLDVQGKAVVRLEYSLGTYRFYRKLEDGKWKKFYSVRRNDLEGKPDLWLVGPSTDPNKFYVLARPNGKDRFGVYLYDLPSESFGEPLVENARYDIDSASSNRDGTGLRSHCYVEHVSICEFSNAELNEHMRQLRSHFSDTANVYIQDSALDGKTILLYINGPTTPPAYYYYRIDQKKLEFVGLRQGALKGKTLPDTKVVNYKARDGLELSGYLTWPPGARGAKGLPLVLMPHGGPWVRDHLEFEPWTQYLAARGYAVFQPNFRGSAGFGLAFQDKGNREWGRKMQDDLTDAVKALADEGTIDPRRVCIVGASYGGYAALAGAAFAPDVYKCAVSIAGIGDLTELIRSKKKLWGEDSEAYKFYLEAIGNPEKDQELLRAASPQLHADAIKIPLLLVHGDEDDIVPYSQSENMQQALNKLGHKTDLLRIKDEGHPYFSDDAEKVVLSTIGLFLWENLGKGYGVNDPPPVYEFKKK